jgi:tRNA modification GTPase
VRVSGERTFELLDAHLEWPEGTEGLRGKGTEGARLVGTRLNVENLELPLLLLRFRGPRSYTGEDCAELQLPGSPVLLERVVDGLINSGKSRGIVARRAGPGEFTARAFFNGKLTITEAEGVAATIAARSDAQLRAAGWLRRGALGSLQEDVVAIAPSALHDRLRSLHGRITAQLDRAVGAEQLEAIPWVVLAGDPNAGKSTLFNALLGRARAVVSRVAGTTRDVLAEPLTIETGHGSAEVMLVDLAGADTAESALNQKMQSAARSAMERAELVLRCVPVDSEGRSDAPGATGSSPARAEVRSIQEGELVVRTKADLHSDRRGGVDPRPRSARAAADQGGHEAVPCTTADHPTLPLAPSLRGRGERAALITVERCADALPVSAKTGEGLDELRRVIGERLRDRAISLAADALALHPRHEAALRSAQRSLTEAIALIEPSRHERVPDPELVAAAMRAALDDLGGLAGQITPDDLLGRIFATFCVGK